MTNRRAMFCRERDYGAESPPRDACGKQSNESFCTSVGRRDENGGSAVTGASHFAGYSVWMRRVDNDPAVRFAAHTP